MFILISRVEFKCDFIRVLTPLCTLKGKSVVFPQMAFKDYHFVLLLFEQGEKIYCQKDTKCVSRKFRQIGRILFSKWAYYVFCVKFEVLNRYVVIFLMTCVCETDLVKADMNREMSWYLNQLFKRRVKIVYFLCKFLLKIFGVKLYTIVIWLRSNINWNFQWKRYSLWIDKW